MLRIVCLVAVGGVLGLVGATQAGAGHGETATSYTGCLKSGKLENVRAGDTPASRCVPPAVEVHFSSGDITAVLNGTGLVGGSTNGSATLGIAPSYQLPQSCTAGQVAESNGAGAWACAADDSATYTAGDGLELFGNEFRIDELYRLPQDCDLGQTPELHHGDVSLREWGCTEDVDPNQACPNGQFATGLGATGTLTCAAGGGGGGALQVFREDAPDAEILDDAALRNFAAVSVPAGTYLVLANGGLQSDGNFDSGTWASCSLMVGGTGTGSGLHETVWDYEDSTTVHMSFSDVITTTGTVLSIGCSAQVGANGAEINDPSIIAVKIG